MKISLLNHCFWCRPADPDFPKAKDRISKPALHHRAGVPPFLAASVAAEDPVSPKFPHEPEWAHELNPSESQNLNNLQVIGPANKFAHVRCPRSITSRRCLEDDQYPCHTDSLVISCHGACPGNDETQASYGVFFGIGLGTRANHHNFAGRINQPVPESLLQPTGQRAEIYAAIEALEQGTQFVKFGGQWHCPDPKECGELYGFNMVGYKGCKAQHLVIKTDSAYVVNSVTEYLGKWVEKGWKTANKKPVKNQDLWKKLVEKIKEALAADAAVQFWLVSKGMNEEAETLAKMALDD
ncbi:putative ribonuclease h protein [Rhypophila sp. PSN 637]